MRTLIIICLLLVVALAASPWFVGGAVESSVRDQLAEFDQLPYYKVNVVDYQRGYRSSVATISVGFDEAMFEAMAGDFDDTAAFDEGIKLIADVQHGPLLTAHGLSLGWTDMTAKFGRESQPEFSEFFDIVGQDNLVDWSMHVGLLGAGWFATELSDVDGVYEKDGTQIDFVLKGMEDMTVFSNAGTSFSGVGALEEFSIVVGSEQEISFSIENVKYDGDVTLEDSIWFGVGEGEGSIGNVRFNLADEFETEIEDLSVHAAMTEGSTSETIDIREVFRAESANFNGYQVNNAELAFGYANISKALIESQILEAELYAENESGELDPEAQERFLQLLEESLIYSPKIEIESIAFESDDGQLDVSASAEINGDLLGAGVSLENPLALIPALTVFADLEISEPILRYIMLAATEAQMAGVPEEQRPNEQEIAQGVDVQLSIVGATLVQQGYIEIDGDVYSSSLSFAEGVATLNGQVVPIPGF